MIRISVKSYWLTLLLAGYFTLVFNVTFFQKTWEAIVQLDHINVEFFASTFLFIFLMLVSLFSFFTVKYISKLFFILLILSSSFVFYLEKTYGIIFDHTMIQNIVQTNNIEFASYLNFQSVFILVATGIFPCVMLTRTQIIYQSFWRELFIKFLMLGVSLAGIAIIGIFYYQDYASVLRNNPHLKKLIIPTQYVSSFYKYINYTYFTENMPYQVLGLDAYHKTKKDTRPVMLVMVVGETSRAENSSYNGYARDTNPYTRKESAISFKSVSSCGTSTAVSVPCMFSFMNRENYDKLHAKNQDNVLDIIQRAGYQISWIDNDGGCKSVCDKVDTVNIAIKPSNKFCSTDSCYDEVVLPVLKDRLARANNKDVLIVLHLIGSHGPTYYRRYPVDHKIFKPDCPRSDIQNCSAAALVNTYDNTIAYTDYVLSQIIDLLKRYAHDYDTAMLYMSDHGESLGEKGLYLHGTPYLLAPKEQTQVSTLLWLSQNYINRLGLDSAYLAETAGRNSFSQDFLSHTLLYLTGVKTALFNPDLNLLN